MVQLKLNVNVLVLLALATIGTTFVDCTVIIAIIL